MWQVGMRGKLSLSMCMWQVSYKEHVCGTFYMRAMYVVSFV